MSLTEGEAAILGKLADIAQKQAVTMERQTGVLERLDSHLDRADLDRAEAVVALKAHVVTAVSASMERSDKQYKRLFIFSAALIALAEFLGVGINKLLALISH